MEYEPARLPDGRIKPPFSPPDCPYEAMSPGTPVPEGAAEFGKLNGDPVYLGRVYDDECWYVGTAVPNKGLCYFINGKFELKSSDSYDILTGDSKILEFKTGALGSRLQFVAAGDQDHCLYAARVVDGENTYIGWVDESVKVAHIPRNPSLGPNQLQDPEYDVLIHTLLNYLCICPAKPPHNNEEKLVKEKKIGFFKNMFSNRLRPIK